MNRENAILCFSDEVVKFMEVNEGKINKPNYNKRNLLGVYFQ